MNILEIAAFLYLATAFVVWILAYRHGRSIVARMSRRTPDMWKEWGEPAPNYLNPVKGRTWMEFIYGDKPEQTDRTLEEMIEKQRQLEKIAFGLSVLFFLIFGGIAAWLQYT
ncbi:MAG: hypothetical protein R3281_17205 [Balneolaceae bacterium]|nr:hypothetical protein [Balneolaceae bacterium]